MKNTRFYLSFIGCALFALNAFAQAPVLSVPLNGSTGAALPLALSWGTVQSASSYDVQVAINSSFSNPVINRLNLTKTCLVVTGLTFNTTYFWRAAVVATCGTTCWSCVWRFTVNSTSTLSADNLGKNVSFSLKKSGITYSVIQTSPVKITIYNLLGKEILGFNQLQAAGNYSFELDNRNLTAGNYLLRFSAGNFEKSSVIQMTTKR